MGPPAILVVRETPSLAASVEEILEGEGYRLVRADSIREANACLSDGGGAAVGFVLVVCNQPVCDAPHLLEPPERPGAGRVPVAVLGWRGPTSVRPNGFPIEYFRLPIRTREFLDRVAELLRSPAPPRGG